MSNQLAEHLEFKSEQIGSALADSMGVILRNKNRIGVVLRSRNLIRLFYEPEKGRTIIVWAVCGFSSERRTLEAEISALTNELKVVFSPKDLSGLMIYDFLSSYLSNNFYARYSYKPLAVEFIIGDVKPSSVNFYVINHDGRSRELKNEGDINIIGCVSDEAKETLAKAILSLPPKDRPLKGIYKNFISLLGDLHYVGDFTGMFFNITAGGDKTKKPITETT